MFNMSFTTNKHLKNIRQNYHQPINLDLRKFVIRTSSQSPSTRNRLKCQQQIEVQAFNKNKQRSMSQNKKQSYQIMPIKSFLSNLKSNLQSCRQKPTFHEQYILSKPSSFRNQTQSKSETHNKFIKSKQSHKKTALKNKSEKKEQKSNQSTNQISKRLNNNNIFQDYMNFIEGKKSYIISVNFEELRIKSRQQAYKEIDLKNIKLIQSIMLCIFDNLEKQGQNSKILIKQYCLLYFNNYQKSKLQLILIHHYFKMFVFKLKPIFIYQRLLIYYIYILTKLNLVYEKSIHTILMISLKNIQQIYTTLLLSIFEMQKSHSQLKINQTFQILRNISQVERKISIIESDLKKLPISTIHPLQQIKRYLLPFINELQSQQSLTKAQMILSWKYLKVPPTPYLPSISSNKNYTLILDLDQTLIYFNQQTNVLKYRPFMDTFLNNIKQQYQLIIFTASSKEYADTLIKQIQNQKEYFDYRLYREHLALYNGRLIKDISRIGRDMNRTIIIDDLKVNFSNNPFNGIEISTWKGNHTDKHLLRLIPFLLQIVTQKIADVRYYIASSQKILSEMVQEQPSIEVQNI